jgi:ribulose-5-phosphate 4-epimerase/fuculose-1-phosphate aldolase
MAKRSIGLKLLVATMSLTAMSLAAVTVQSKAQTPAAADTNEARIEDLITASHILANEGILDSFGHTTVRSVTDPTHFFMPRAMPPALVARADIVELDLDCKPVTPNAPRLNGERYIHCEIYKARPDVQSVIHSHDLAVIPFGLTGTPLRPVVAQAGFLPKETPLFEVRDAYGPSAAERGVLVLNSALGKALATKLGNNPVVLMRGHGETVVGRSVKEATVRALYTNIDARAQAAATPMGTIVALDDAELATNARENFDADRPWENYRQRMLKAQAH